MKIERIDELTNEIMDIVRAEFGTDSDSDQDDELYTKIHNMVREAL